MFFQISSLKSSSQWANAVFGYTCNPYRRGGGGRSESCGRLVYPTLQSKLEYAGMKLEYLTYITMYVNSYIEILLIFSSEFTCHIQQPKIKSKHSRTCNRYRKGAIRKLWLLGIPNITIKTWVCWDETRISQLYHYVCEQLEILLMFFFSEFTSNIQQPIRKSKLSCILVIDIGRGDDQKVLVSGCPRQNNRNMIMLGGNQIISATTLCM